MLAATAIAANFFMMCGLPKMPFRAGETFPSRERRDLVLPRSEEHTSELQSLMRISYAVFCLKKKNVNQHITLALVTTTNHNTHPNTLYIISIASITNHY